MKLRTRADSDAPPPLFARLAPGASFATSAPTSVAVTSMRVVFGSLTTADWTWDAAKHAWLRTSNGTVHVLEGGARLAADCLILQTVPYQSTPYTDRSGTGVDEAVITGTGKAQIACDGRVIDGRWSKPSQRAVTTYSDATGKPILIPIGRVWVSFVPTNGVITRKLPVTTATTVKR